MVSFFDSNDYRYGGFHAMSSQSPSRSTVFATNLVTLLLILSAVFGVYVLASGLVGAIRGGHEVVAHQEVAVGTIDSLPENAVGPERLRVPLRIEDASPEQNLYAVGRDIVPGLLVIAVLWLLRRILVSVRQGDPFTAANVRRLRIIGRLRASARVQRLGPRIRHRDRRARRRPDRGTRGLRARPGFRARRPHA
jgi:hypothetical protein